MQSPDIHIFLKKAQKIKVKNDTLFLAMIRAKKIFWEVLSHFCFR